MKRPPKPKRMEHRALGSAGGTREWSRFVKRVVREEPTCWLRLPGCTIASQTADHIIPRKFRPDLTLVRSNAHGACHHCNRARGATPVYALAALRATMEASGKYRDPGRRPPKALGFFE